MFGSERMQMALALTLERRGCFHLAEESASPGDAFWQAVEVIKQQGRSDDAAQLDLQGAMASWLREIKDGDVATLKRGAELIQVWAH